MIHVERAGPLSTVQDRGRVGWAHLGVPRAGALDRPALEAANRLVGNGPGAAGLELTLGRCTLRVSRDTTVALTGAPAPFQVDGRPAPYGRPVRAGATITVGAPREGVRSYLAFDGGIAVAPVLGSRSTDTLSGLGPAPLRDGDTLPLGPPGPAVSTGDSAQWTAPPGPLVLRVAPGPRADWFADALATDGLVTDALATYTISPHGNRIGARLAGPALTRVRGGELPSEGVVLGAVQVPPDGQPLVFLADHPTTGGYPVIAVVVPADLALLAQARPGTTVVFRGPQQ